ncbi:MAG: DUF6090 family protein [Cyclobacteriaceae bacterium]
MNNKFTTYLLYAIGEIVLVVVGILIAVSIDDWSERQKKTSMERKVLLEIEVDLQNDLDEIRNEIKNHEWILRCDSTLEVFFYSSEPFSDTIASFVYAYEISPHFNPIAGGYQLLMAKGIDLVTNDTLRQEINRYYEQDIPYYHKYESERIHTVLNDFIPFNNQYFHLGRVPYFPYWKRLPYELQDIRQNRQWLSIIQKSRNLSWVLLTKARYLEKTIIYLQEIVKTELNK